MSDPRPGLGIDDLWVATLTPDPDARARSLLALAPEHLLLVGGDDRQLPRPGTARNAYGFPVVDLDPVVRGSSCTATPPDSVALADVSAWAGALDASIAGNGLPSADTLHEQVATRLLEHLDFDPTACERVLLTPSGTDAESLVTALVLATTDRSLCNIVVGAAEAGSGTIPAALGRWFSRRTPFCTDVTVEARIPGFPADQVRLVDVELRDHRGRARRAFDVEAEVEAHIEDALERDEHVLVHAMAGSKTELRQLTPDWIRIWRARGAGRVHVVVDAAQARIAPATMRDYLDAGASVAFTGSKALGAPPFCGAIVLDATFMHEVMAAVDSGARLPTGLEAVVASADLPRWARGMLPGAERANLGLLARWHVALCELDRYRAIPAVWRADFRHRLHAALVEQLDEIPAIEVIDPASATIVSFVVRTPAGAPAGRGDARELYERLVSQPGVQFGQPVELVPGGPAALRYAIGSVTTSRPALTGASAADAAHDAVTLAVEAVRRAVEHARV